MLPTAWLLVAFRLVKPNQIEIAAGIVFVVVVVVVFVLFVVVVVCLLFVGSFRSPPS